MSHLNKFMETLFNGPHTVRFLAMDQAEAAFNEGVRGEYRCIEIQGPKGRANLHVNLGTEGSLGGHGLNPSAPTVAGMAEAISEMTMLVEVAKELQSLVRGAREVAASVTQVMEARPKATARTSAFLAEVKRLYNHLIYAEIRAEVQRAGVRAGIDMLTRRYNHNTSRVEAQESLLARFAAELGGAR